MSYTPPTIGQEPWGEANNQALADIDATAEAAQSTADGKVDPGDLASVATSGAYADLTGKPAIPDSPDDIGALPDSYTPPDQSWSQITGKPSEFPPSSHTHSESDVSGLTSDLAGKAAVGHTHPADDIVSGTLPVARGGTGLSGGPDGDYLKFGGGNTVMGTISPSSVRSDIGAADAEDLPSSSVDTSLSLTFEDGSFDNGSFGTSYGPLRFLTLHFVLGTTYGPFAGNGAANPGNIGDTLMVTVNDTDWHPPGRMVAVGASGSALGACRFYEDGRVRLIAGNTHGYLRSGDNFIISFPGFAV